MTRLFWIAVLLLAGLIARPAFAQEAFTVSDLNLRAGPSAAHQIIATIPRGGAVYVRGCVSRGSWCDVQWHNLRGYVSSRYLSYAGAYVSPPVYVAPPAYSHPPSVIFEFHDGPRYQRPYDYRRRYREPRKGRPVPPEFMDPEGEFPD